MRDLVARARQFPRVPLLDGDLDKMVAEIRRVDGADVSFATWNRARPRLDSRLAHLDTEQDRRRVHAHYVTGYYGSSPAR